MSFLERLFRASSKYQLVQFERLDPDDRRVMEDLGEDSDFYGVLRPAAGSGGTLKAVNRDTALLLLALREPGPLPRFARRLEGQGTADEIARLVLDGILEVQTDEGFLTGARATRVLGDTPAVETASKVLPRLSTAALEYAEALGLDDPYRLSGRLYGYNRIPLSARWVARLPDPSAVLKLLGLSPGSLLRARLRRDFLEDERSLSDTWMTWAGRGQSAWGAEGQPTFKLYVSPMPDHVPAALEALAAALARCPSSRFKVATTAAGILRPDKLVAYFQRREELLAAAEDLARRLAGAPTQGVPFTGEITGDGLLSWGADPPGSERATWWQPPESWRLWLTNRLAIALIAARREPEGPRPAWAFARERVRLEGVDVERWIPAPGLWAGGAARGR